MNIAMNNLGVDFTCLFNWTSVEVIKLGNDLVDVLLLYASDEQQFMGIFILESDILTFIVFS